MEPKNTPDGVLIPQGNYVKINTKTAIPFCDGELEIEIGMAALGDYRIILAQLEILGIPIWMHLKNKTLFLNREKK